MDEKEKPMPFFKRLYGHLHTVHVHRKNVRRNCFACGLYWQGLTHDLSKYSLYELIPSVKYYQGWRSPYQREKELKGYSLGWLHHKGHNKHHWEYWYDTINGVWQPIEMPYRYAVESCCDRIAACKTYMKDKYREDSALNYFNTKNDQHYMHPNTAKTIRHILTLVAEKGEKEAFAEVKQSIRENRPL